MATPSLYQQTGLSIAVDTPPFAGFAPPVVEYTDGLLSYSHVIGADGGYLSANIGLAVSVFDMFRFVDTGVGADATISDARGVIFNGFINRLTINMGTLSLGRGPLFDVANRVSVVYTPIIDTNFDPPIVGVTTETLIAEDEGSQDRYGIIEKILSGGQLLDDGTTNEAEEVRDLYLSEMKELYSDQSLNVTNPDEPSLTLEILGYHEFLKVYAYNDLNPLSVTFTTKVLSVLAADPNNVISTDTSDIDTNPLLTSAYEDQNRFAETVIRDMVVQGDGSDNRWIFGVLNDRKAYYHAVPSSARYEHRVTQNDSKIIGSYGDEIDPWRVQAGEWVFLADIPVVSAATTVSRADPRYMFIEQANFTAPNTLSLQGSRMNTVDQRLAQLGVKGA